MIRSARRTCCLLALVCCVHVKLAVADPPGTQDANPSSTVMIRQYRSSTLHVRTDLPEADAELLYERLEETLSFSAQYWGRKSKGQIDCYVVHNLSAWTDAQLPHRLARVIIDGVGGATMPKIVGVGKLSRNLPTVYASSKPGVAEHELVHAYCIHTFGSSGPEWYKEGMAEMAVKGSNRESGIQCSAQQSATLRAGDGTSLAKIFATGSTGLRIATSLRRMMDDPTTQGQHVRPEVWTQIDADNVAQARDEYLHSWAFCYMMLHNPNYSKRFRSLGNVFIAEQRNAFDDFFAPVRDKIEFEHQLFLKHASVGYRVDLCSWDWNHRFTTSVAGETQKTRVVAARGFQASGVTVNRDTRYDYQTEGRWSLSADGQQTDADGGENRAGQLVGVVLDDRTLGEPFLLGISGTFQPATSGNLYLRCHDAWNEISDNTGQMTVTIRGE
ncbi:MAG: hypothetical protein O3C40_31465 [Planctomycetota bacterium]|nr:hypothetical protein [Planctomycetota bacterium]